MSYACRRVIAVLPSLFLAAGSTAAQCSQHQGGRPGGGSMQPQTTASVFQPQMTSMTGLQWQTTPPVSPAIPNFHGFCGNSAMFDFRIRPPLFSVAPPATTGTPTFGFPASARPLQLLTIQPPQPQQIPDQKHQDVLLKTDQLKTLHLQLTTLQDKLTALDQASTQDPTRLNDLQHEVNVTQDQLNGVSKPPQGLVRQMSAVQDQMRSLQQRVTARPEDVIAALRRQGIR